MLGVGIFSAFRLQRAGLRETESTQLALTSPWAPPAGLSQLTIADLYGTDIAQNLPLDRSVAITVPAVSRARNLLISQIMGLPLVALDKNGPLEDQPTWLYRTNGPVSPQERLACTIDDGIFHGIALWLTERGVGDPGQILGAAYVPFDDWKIDDGEVWARPDGTGEWYILDETDYILINFPFDGLLTVAAGTIRGALSTEEAWVGRMRNPIPLIELKVTDDSQLDPEEIEEHVKTWAKARTGVNGAVSWTPPGMEVRDHGSVQADLFTEGRNAIRTDIGSFVNIPTSLMDGSLAEASLTYVTTEGNQNRFQVEAIPFWIGPIEAALSMDKCVPAGTRVRFDRSDALAVTLNPTGEPTLD